MSWWQGWVRAHLPALLGCNDWGKVPKKNQLLSRPAVSSDKNSLPAEWAVIVSEQKTWSQSSAGLFDPLLQEVTAVDLLHLKLLFIPLESCIGQQQQAHDLIFLLQNLLLGRI